MDARGRAMGTSLAMVVALVVTLGGGAFGLAGPAEQKPRGGVLRIAEGASPGGPFGVPWTMPVFGILPAVPVYETLIWVDAYGRVSPKLAERWEIAPDRKALIFRLRRGVLFHDGTELSAEAVKFSLENSLRVGRLPRYIRSVDVLDRYVVRVNLEKWDNGVFLSLGGSAALIASPSTIQRLGQERAQWQPVGTGPFRVTRYDPSAYAHYVRFDRYWDRPKPYLDRIELRFFPQAQPLTLQAALLAGEVDMARFADPQIIDQLRATGRFQVITGPPSRGILMLIPDSANPDSPFADRRVREALGYALDRVSLARVLGAGLGESWAQIAPPESPAVIADFRSPTYNPERAKELLAQAGYPSGFSTRLIPAFYLQRDVGVALQGALQAVGIRADLEIPPVGRYYEYQQKGWRGLLAHIYGYFPNFNTYIQFYLGPTAREVWASLKRPEGFEKVLEESTGTLTPQRHKLQQLHRMLLQDHTVIPVYTSPGAAVVARREVRDTGHLQGQTWPWWKPAEAWWARR